LASRGRLANHVKGDAQEFRTQNEMGPVDGIQIDGEADVILRHHELDHASALEKVRGITDRENLRTAEDRQVLADVLVFEGADVNNGAGPGFSNVRVPDMNGEIADFLIGSEGI
jgi:hypothetical protein